ncbi:MAG: class I tRNA ligase family protein [Ignavibacteriales bacterium]|nr:class I tRNA ligase family protein [Ignavibacteriales bacterium]
MLGDTAVAVHPDDERYAGLDRHDGRVCRSSAGRSRSSPTSSWTRRSAPARSRSRPRTTRTTSGSDSGTGCPQINIFDISAPDERRTCRRRTAASTASTRASAVVDDLEATRAASRRSSTHRTASGTCYRCDTVIEPYLSRPVVREDGAAGRTGPRGGAKTGTIRFYPERWTKVYQHWMTNIRDWCISRQLWWGHRIPVWYCERRCGECADRQPRRRPTACPTCGGSRPAPGRGRARHLVLLLALALLHASAGPTRTRRRTSGTSTRPTLWSPAPTSSSSGWRG